MEWKGYSSLAGDLVIIGERSGFLLLSLPQSLSPELTARLHIVAKQHWVPESLAGKAVLLACATKNSKLALSVRCLNNPRYLQAVKGQVTVQEHPECPGRK